MADRTNLRMPDCTCSTPNDVLDQTTVMLSRALVDTVAVSGVILGMCHKSLVLSLILAAYSVASVAHGEDREEAKKDISDALEIARSNFDHVVSNRTTVN